MIDKLIQKIGQMTFKDKENRENYLYTRNLQTEKTEIDEERDRQIDRNLIDDC